MQLISIVSVPHTGTKFTDRVLQEMGFDTRHTHFHNTHPAQNALEWLGSGVKIVVPWRDPELARISALNRGQEPRPPSDFVELLKWTEAPHVHLFNVDIDNDIGQILELRALSAFLDTEIPLFIDWTPINTSEDVTGLKHLYLHGSNDG